MRILNRRENYIIIAFIPIFFLLPIVTRYMILDDYWFHIRIGSDILSGVDIFNNEIYSWYGAANGLQWLNHEWMSEIIMTMTADIFGEYCGAVVYMGITFCIMYIIVIVHCKNWLFSNAYGCIMTNLAVFAVFLAMTPRPHAIGLILFVMLIAALENIRNNRWSGMYFLFPVVTILWNNMHGGSVILSVILPLMYLIVSFIKAEWLQFPWIANTLFFSTGKQRMGYLYLALSGAAGMFVHPNGIASALTCFRTNAVQTGWISEWLPATIVSDPVAFAVIFIMITYVIGRKSKLEMIDIIMAGAFVLLTLKSRRFQFWMVLTVPFYLNRYLPDNLNIDSIKKYINKWVKGAFIAAGICSVVLSVINTDTDEKPQVSNELCEYLKEIKPQRLFNSYNLGDYLIYLDIPVFTDGRAHMYQDTILEEAFMFEKNYGGIESFVSYEEESDVIYQESGRWFYKGHAVFNIADFIEEYQFDYYLLEASAEINAYLSSRNDMEIVYSDDNTLLWRYKNED